MERGERVDPDTAVECGGDDRSLVRVRRQREHDVQPRGDAADPRLQQMLPDSGHDGVTAAPVARTVTT